MTGREQPNKRVSEHGRESIDLIDRTITQIKGPFIFILVALIVIWILLPQLPSWIDIHFGIRYKLFFTIYALAIALFLALLNLGPISQPKSKWGVVLSIVLAYLLAIGLPLSVGIIYPQYEIPESVEEIGEPMTMEELGKEIFLRPDIGCFACHSIEAVGIRGGERAPDLSNAGELAGTRIPGETAEEYFTNRIKKGADPERFIVPGYPPIMPPFGERLTDVEIANLVAFLKSLKGGESGTE